MAKQCSTIPNSLDGINLAVTGWHRDCYSRFTNTSRLKEVPDKSATSTALSPPSAHSPRKPLTGEEKESRIFPPDICLFCDKTSIKSKGGHSYRRPDGKFVAWKHKKSGWEKIEGMAKDLQNEGRGPLLRRVAGVDLAAKEAPFHTFCRTEFYTQHNKWTAKQTKPKSPQDPIIGAHEYAFSEVKKYTDKHVIVELEIIPLTLLRDQYISNLKERGFPNPAYRSENLMNKLKKDEDMSKKISFSKVDWKGCVSFWLVFSSSMSISSAVAASYLAASKDRIQETALYLKEVIERAFKASKELPWPPTVEDISELSSENLPEELERFLTIVFSGNEPKNNECERTKRFVVSIGQDLCRAVTEGKWKLAKHILLCTTIRHLYRSKQLTTILNRLCHCESYSYGLELETAMAKAIEESDTYITPQIVTGDDNVVFHSEWDNLNKIKTNITGSNVVNSAAGIMLQERKQGATPSTDRTGPQVKRNKKRSLQIDAPAVLAPVTLYTRVGPKFPKDAKPSPPPENESAFETSANEHLLWFMSR